jgi:type II secretory pathway component GspD/PulD (secretin)
MKTMLWKTCLAVCACGLLLSANAQPDPGGPDGPAAPPADLPPPPDIGVDTAPADPADAALPARPATITPAPTAPTGAMDKTPAADAPAATESMPEIFTPSPETAGTNELRLNFRNAPLELVLNYLSDAAGFIIVMDTQVRGTVSVISSHPMTRDEAVDLLNAALNKNGYAALRDGRTLTIVSKTDAKTRNIPVKIGNNPDRIPKNEEIVTQIIPIRYVEAKQLVTDLSSFVSPQALVVANEAGNSIVITDTQSNIRHLAEIIQAIDNSAEGETEIRVFHLKHANPADVATELSSIFPGSSGSSAGQSQTPFRFGGGGQGGGPGGFFGRMMAANNASAGGSQNARVQKQTQVTAVADARTSSVIVTASKDLMQEIAGMMDQLDVASTRDQKVYVFHMNNADPQQAAQVLQTMFQTSTSTRGSSSSSGASSQNSALMVRQQNNASSSSSSTSASTTSSSLGGSSTGARGVGSSSF